MDLAKDQNANRTLSISDGIDHVIHIVQTGMISFHEPGASRELPPGHEVFTG